MINNNLMDELNRLGFGADIDALELYVVALQDAVCMGKPIVTDTVYEQHVKLLKELRPDSYVINRNKEYEEENLTEHDILLSRYPIRDGQVVNNMSHLNTFKDSIGEDTTTLVAMDEPDGHTIRAVYVNGELTTGTVKGLIRKGRDITRQLKATLPNYIEAWRGIRVVEVRGTMIVPLDKFEEVKHLYRTPLSAVTCLLRDGVTDGELKYLSCICNKVVADNLEKMYFESKWEELEHLESKGFNIPTAVKLDDVSRYNLGQIVDDILEYFGELQDGGRLNYKTDGVAVYVNNNQEFDRLGIHDDKHIGHFILKMGPHWEGNIYSSKILEIKWEPGKKYLVPRAIIEPVITVTGVTVTSVPLFNLGVVEKYNYTPDNIIHFRFGGYDSVSVVKPNGTPISAIE